MPSTPTPVRPGSSSTSQLEKLRHELAQLQKDNTDAEELYLETRKELATSRDETKLLDQELVNE